MSSIIILLTIIAVGVLLQSEAGQLLLVFGIGAAAIAGVLFVLFWAGVLVAANISAIVAWVIILSLAFLCAKWFASAQFTSFPKIAKRIEDVKKKSKIFKFICKIFSTKGTTLITFSLLAFFVMVVLLIWLTFSVK